MKYCPACHNQYTDATLRFCLQDGTALHAGEPRQSTIDTVSFNNSLTADNILRTEEMNLFAPPLNPEKTQSLPVQPPRSYAEPERSKSSAKLWLAVFPVLFVIAGAGFGGWFYLKNQNKPAAVQTTNPADAATPAIAAQTPPANNSTSNPVLDELSQPPNSNSQPSSSSGSEDVKKEIADAVELWKKAAEARKLPDYLSKYAEKVDYFDKTGVGLAEIRTEAQKMFNDYSEIEINVTNLRVAVDAGGNQATAVFDKEWSYETATDLLEGKAHTKLQFQKNGKEWKITGEKYQKVYYMEN